MEEKLTDEILADLEATVLSPAQAPLVAALRARVIKSTDDDADGSTGYARTGGIRPHHAPLIP